MRGETNGEAERVDAAAVTPRDCKQGQTTRGTKFGGRSIVHISTHTKAEEDRVASVLWSKRLSHRKK